MQPLAVGLAVVGGALVFFLPGFTVAKAIFPERRLQAPDGVQWAVELIGLAFILSVVFTVLVGYVLLAGVPGGFQASWSDPVLEASLATIAIVGFVAGWLDGAYAGVPPRRATPAAAAPSEPGTAAAWELTERLDRLQRERLTLERELRQVPSFDEPAVQRLRTRLAAVVEEEDGLRRTREAEYDR